ncbi:MAG: M1 family metallopeptidase [Acidobacteriota bacterium]
MRWHTESMAVVLLLVLVPGCGSAPVAPPKPGVTWQLARERAERISNLGYRLYFSVPVQRNRPVLGRVRIEFRLRSADRPLVLDFKQSEKQVHRLRIGGRDGTYQVLNSHIVLDSSQLRVGDNRLEIEFEAGDGPLNRRGGYLYTLFVPNRASEAFPCFDQPDLKARFDLELEVPNRWRAVSNAPETGSEQEGIRKRVRFLPTRPISTYLFAFAAGDFQMEEGDRGQWHFRMFHRETDRQKVERNRETLFDLHAAALSWLEEYTRIPYPFQKFDFFLIPSFQFGGMEHPGAILYRDSGLLMSQSPTQSQMLRRASVIAHETTHMWFGDLVTMRWFDDVWTKEVFANFMAAKIVNPSFPAINHKLRFFLTHYPAAYQVDRTRGTHPIRQKLANLEEAGQLYGAIIYQKAPIVMRQLERLVGAEAFREGLREYLKRFQFANASWPELIAILDKRSEEDLTAWSGRWVEEAGRPTITTRVARREDGSPLSLLLEQSDPWGEDRHWVQELDVTLYSDARSKLCLPLRLDRVRTEVPLAAAGRGLKAVLPASGGWGYGLFEVDDLSRNYLLDHLAGLEGERERAAGWVILWEEMLEGRVGPDAMLRLGIRVLSSEDNELIVQRVLNDLVETLYWRLLSDSARRLNGPRLEALLWKQLGKSVSCSMKAAYFGAWRDLVRTPEGLQRLGSIWEGKLRLPGLVFEEADFMRMALEIAVRGVHDSQQVLSRQLARIQNSERRARFQFVQPALSSQAGVRAHFFQSLRQRRQRRRERWVLEALHYLHHPLRARESIPLIAPALDLLDEIQQTGDIFFPKRWLDATLWGHRSARAASIVRGFLDRHPDYPARLRSKILQSADLLFRASRISRGEAGG